MGPGLAIGQNVAAQSGGGAFTPASLPNLAAWYDADQQTEASGAGVATLVDRSGNGKNFIQATGGSQPTLTFAAINGKKALSFNGSSTSMTCTAGLLNSASAGAWFAVVKLSADPPALAGPVFDGFTSGAFDNYHPFTDGVIYDGFGVTARNTCGNPTPSLASTALIGTIAGPGDYRFLVNNTTLFSTAGSTIGFGTGTRNLGINNATDRLAGLVAEIIVTSAVPSAGDIANIVSYVNTKFGTAF
jgi:hypothetical protein